MLSRLILLALQLVVAWFGAPYIVRYIPGMGRMEIFVYAAVFAVIVWIVGLVLSQVLRDTGQPSSAHAGLGAGRGADRRGHLHVAADVRARGQALHAATCRRRPIR